jgi:hypothetical protein
MGRGISAHGTRHQASVIAMRLIQTDRMAISAGLTPEMRAEHAREVWGRLIRELREFVLARKDVRYLSDGEMETGRLALRDVAKVLRK